MALRMFTPDLFIRRSLLASALLSAGFIAACGGDTLSMFDDNNNQSPDDPRPLLVSNARKAAVSGAEPTMFAEPVCNAEGQPTRDGGGNYRVAIPSASGETIVFQVFEPATFNCQVGAPLVLDGHGYGGSRRTSTGSTVAEVIVPNIAGDLVAANMGVISIDQRGFGESTGTVRVMDPDFEGQDLLAILDWAEANLDWMRYRLQKTGAAANAPREYNLMLGATGSSYGGGYQFLIHNIDPKGRMDVMTPDITWNDLRSSLNPGATYARAEGTRRPEENITARGGVKAGWVLGLVSLGEAGSRMATPQDGQDPLIIETLTNGLITNIFPDGALNFFRYHSPSYYCDDEPLGLMSFAIGGNVTALTSKAKPRGVDILITQGMRDTLFPFNEAAWNFKCYRELAKVDGTKPDVRLFTHQSGHILPVSIDTIPEVGPALNDILTRVGLISLPEFQSPAGAPACESTRFGDAQFLFLAEKLLSTTEFQALQDSLNSDKKNALKALNANKGKVCLSADDTTGTGVLVSEETFLASLMPAAKGDLIRASATPIAGAAVPASSFGFALPAPANLPVPIAGNLVTGLVTSLLPAAVSSGPLARPGGDIFVAGIPAGTVTISPAIPVGESLNPACAQIAEGAAALPLNLSGLTPGCDPIVLLGLGIRREGRQAATLIDDQLVPVRGYGTRHVEFTGVAERLGPGDQLVVMAYAFHPQYVVTGSRDLLSLGVQISGNVQLPVVNTTGAPQVISTASRR